MDELKTGAYKLPPKVFLVQTDFMMNGKLPEKYGLSSMYHGQPEFSGQPMIIKRESDDRDGILKFCRVYISRDPKTDAQLGMANEKKLHGFLHNDYGTKPRYVKRLTDNCAKQYKSAETMNNATKINALHGTPYGVSHRERMHGGDDYDVECGIVKAGIVEAARQGVELRDGDLTNAAIHLNKHLSKPISRSAVKLQSRAYIVTDVDEVAKHHRSDFGSIKGTQTYNDWLASDQTESIINMRRLFCLRPCCMEPDKWDPITHTPNNCELREWTGEWHYVKIGKSASTPRPVSELE